MGAKSLILIVAVLFIISIAVFISLGNFSKSGGTANNKTVAGTAPKTLVEVNDIIGNPIVYDGLNVEVESQINEWITKKTFKVSAPGGAFGGGGKPLIVIAKNVFILPQSYSVKKLGLGEKVRVHMIGKVAIVSKDQLQEYMGENLDSDQFKLDDNNFTAWTLGPVLLLDSVEKI